MPTSPDCGPPREQGRQRALEHPPQRRRQRLGRLGFLRRRPRHRQTAPEESHDGHQDGGRREGRHAGGGPGWRVCGWCRVRPKTVVVYRVDAAHIVRAIGDVELTAEHVEQLYAAILASGCSAGTVHHVRRTLSAALTTAAQRGRLARNPVPAATTPTHTAARVEPLSEAEAHRVLAAGGRHAARWALALLVGPRQGEVLGLRWDDVDLTAGTIHIRRSLGRMPWRHGCGATPAAASVARTARPGMVAVWSPVRSKRPPASA